MGLAAWKELGNRWEERAQRVVSGTAKCARMRFLVWTARHYLALLSLLRTSVIVLLLRRNAFALVWRVPVQMLLYGIFLHQFHRVVIE